MKNKDKFVIGGISLIVFITLIIVNFISPKIEINLNGQDKIDLDYGTPYQELGGTAYIHTLFNKKPIDLEIIGSVDNNKIGKYIITYKAEYQKKTKELTRVVTISDTTGPSISLNKPIVACKNNNIVELDVKVVDNYDGDISSKLEYDIKNDKITLYAIDSSENKTEIVEDLKYIDNEAPTLKLNGNATIYLNLGDEYIEYGATAYDSCDGNITGDITISSSVNTSVVGTYEVVYSIKDKANKIAKITRTVIVEDKKNLSQAGVIYLTFDDGPGQYTETILNTLDKYNIKATFFVTNQFPNYQYMIKKESEKGHTVGIHTYSHKWTIYKSVDTYLEDFNKIEQIVYEQTGNHPKYFRFPGGSSNTVSRSYCVGIMTNLAKIMTEKGYIYFDWTFDSGDTRTNHNSTSEIISTVKKYLKPNQSNIILMHDIKKNTMEALPTIIEYALSQGYTFKAIDNNTPVKHFTIAN